jgi:hypothetical protein
MVYTPRLSWEASASVKSLSFALGVPMTKTLERVIARLPVLFSPKEVCEKCKDKTRCVDCVFNMATMPEEIKKMLPFRV